MNLSEVWVALRSAMSLNFNGLLDKLIQQHQLIDLNASGNVSGNESALEAFLNDTGDGVVLLTEEPDKVPESWDLAVIFPSLLATTRIQPRAAISRPEFARSLLIRFGVQRMPALLFIRDGAYVGVIEGLRDWNELVAEYHAMLLKPASRARTIGIAVTAATTSTCSH